MPKIVDHESRKKEILLKAQEIFASKGYFNTRMSMIADEAGVARTTIYQYFVDKEEIFRHTLGFVFDEKEIVYIQIMEDETKTPFQRLRVLADRILEDCYDEKNIFSLLVEYILQLKRQNSDYADYILTRLRTIQHYFEVLLRKARDAGEIKDTNTVALSLILFSLVESFVVQHSLFEESTFEQNREAVRLLIEGLQP